MTEGPLPVPSVHYYKNSGFSLAKIRIKAIYFVPQDKRNEIYPQWQSALTNALSDLISFHENIFRGFSRVSFDIFPEPIVGRENSYFYDTDITERGNPAALKNVYREVGERALDSGGDLFDEHFVRSAEDEYVVYYFLYEGVGASGSENVALFSSAYLSDENYKANGASIFYHEFAHTLGIPDHYDEEGNSTSLDIMGFGLQRPLAFNYLDEEVLREMGL